MRFVVLLSIFLVSHLGVRAQDLGAHPEPALRGTLEIVYNSWRNAMATENLELWEDATALSRQMQTRNRIVSQKAPFPQALFADSIPAPTLGGLISLGVFSTGETATSTYFGRADFGEGEAPVSDNIIVLQFLLEEGQWRFDKLRVVKMGNSGEILLKIRNQDFSFMNSEEFQPEPTLPAIPQPVSEPDFIGEIWVTSIGYETEISVNGHSSGKVKDSNGKDLVIGGIRKGENEIIIRTKKLPLEGSDKPRLEIAIYSAAGPGEPAKRIFHFSADTEVKDYMKETFRSP